MEDHYVEFSSFIMRIKVKICLLTIEKNKANALYNL